MKIKFNIVDVVIVFIVIAAIAVGCYLYFRPTETNTNVVENTTKIRFVIEVKDLTETAANSFKNAKGSKVSFGETSTGSGIVVDVEVSEYEKWVENPEEGIISIQKVPEKYTVKVVVESDVVKTDTSYTSGKENVSVGKEMPFNAFGAGKEKGCYIIDLYEVEVKWGVFCDFKFKG